MTTQPPSHMSAEAPTSVTSIEDSSDDINLLDLVETISENLRLLVLTPILVGLIALCATYAVTPIFTANTTFLPPQQQSSMAASLLANLGALGGLAGAATDIKNPNDQFITMMQSRALRDRLVQRFDLQARYEADALEDARRVLLSRSRIAAGKDGLINVEFDDPDPTFAAEVANAYIEELGRLLDRLAITEAQQRRLFYGRQLNQTREKLAAAQVELSAVGIDPSVVMTQPQAAVGALATLEAQITAQELKIASMRGYLSDTAPDVKQALNELLALQKQLNKLSISNKSTASQSEKTNYVQRYRDYKYHEALFELFSKQFEAARIDEAAEGALIQVLDVAIPPQYKSSPKRSVIAAMAALLSGFVLLIGVFVRQAVRNAARDPQTDAQMATIRAHLRRAIRGS